LKKADPGTPTLYAEKTDRWSSHTILHTWIQKFAKGTRILDVGAAHGIIGRQCAGLGFILKGIEPNRDWAETARDFYSDMLCSTIEAAPEGYLADQDVILCADVLEHTPDPQTVLARLVSLQHPGARFLVSVPNVANIWVRLQLLFGKFEYADKGILDRTHLRFFTRATFKQMLSECHLQVVEMKYTPIPLNLVHPFFQDCILGRGMHWMLAQVTQFIPALFAYQFVAHTILVREGGS
jgi:2-polyprenyl-3-methyl-5-hydroxy-6-metoxy-1,4-benzoquinol methylase